MGIKNYTNHLTAARRIIAEKRLAKVGRSRVSKTLSKNLRKATITQRKKKRNRPGPITFTNQKRPKSPITRANMKRNIKDIHIQHIIFYKSYITYDKKHAKIIQNTY